MDDEEFCGDGYTQRARAVTEACIALDQLKSTRARVLLAKSITAMIYHLDPPKGELKLLPLPDKKEAPL